MTLITTPRLQEFSRPTPSITKQRNTNMAGHALYRFKHIYFRSDLLRKPMSMLHRLTSIVLSSKRVIHFVYLVEIRTVAKSPVIIRSRIFSTTNAPDLNKILTFYVRGLHVRSIISQQAHFLLQQEQKPHWKSLINRTRYNSTNDGRRNIKENKNWRI